MSVSSSNIWSLKWARNSWIIAQKNILIEENMNESHMLRIVGLSFSDSLEAAENVAYLIYVLCTYCL